MISMELTDIHPGIYICYYLILVLFAFIFNNPFFSITFLVLMIVLIYLQELGSEVKNILKLYIPMGLLIVILNPLFNKTGAHKLYLFSNFFITYEALIYGILMSISLLIVLLVFTSYNKSVSYQDMLHIFSKKLPIISMIIIMALRFVPLLNNRAREIAKINKLSLQNESFVNKARTMGKIMGITIAWSLEESMFTAKSMKSRGYGSFKRTSYLSYEFSKMDYFLSVLICCCVAILAYGLLNGFGVIAIYPSIEFSFTQTPLNIYYFTFIVLLSPLICLELREALLWH